MQCEALDAAHLSRSKRDRDTSCHADRERTGERGGASPSGNTFPAHGHLRESEDAGAAPEQWKPRHCLLRFDNGPAGPAHSSTWHGNVERGSDWRHSPFTKAYNDFELEFILAYLRSTVQP